MYIHEYGNPTLPTIILLHPMEVTGVNMYQIISPYLKGQYHIISPDQGGHGQAGPYTDCKTEAAELEKWLLEKEYTEIALLYGASMGVTVAYELVKNGKLHINKMLFDGGGLAPNAGFMNWMMKTMFIKKHRALAKDPSAPSTNLIKMYGEEFAAMMKDNFMKLSEQDLIRICYACSHRELKQLSPEIRKNICFEYGQSDPNLNAAKKIIGKYYPESRLVVREGYGHCGYMAFHTRQYVEEMEEFLNEEFKSAPEDTQNEEFLNEEFKSVPEDTQKGNFMKKSLKYRLLLKLFRIYPAKKIMAMPPEKTQEFFGKMNKGMNIPTLRDSEISVSKGEVNGFPVLYYKHREETAGRTTVQAAGQTNGQTAGQSPRLVFYLVGGGMLKHPQPSQTKEVLKLAKECGVNLMLPYYPTVFSGKTLPDVYAMLYALYKKALRKYKAEDICFAGGSSGGNLALGLISYINDMAEGVPVPGKVYAGSPGTLLLTDEERKLAAELEKTDVIMSVKATENIFEGMTGGREVPEYMKYLQRGDYTGLRDAYLSFGGEEVFRAGAESISQRLEEAGVHVTLEIAEGLYHSYAMMPLVNEAEDGYRNFKKYIAE